MIRRLVLSIVIVVGLGVCFAGMWALHGEAQPLPGDYPFFNIDVHQHGNVVIEFIQMEGRAGAQQRVPVLVDYVTVDTGWEPTERLWAIYTKDPQALIERVTYGVVPPGFIQITPAEGVPAPLEKGRLYYISARGRGMATRSFTYAASGSSVGSPKK